MRLSIAILLICILPVVSSRPAKAQIGISQGQAVGIVVVFAAVVAGVTVLVYYMVRQPPTITGCAVAGANGLTLENESDHQAFFLIGDTAAVKPGDRIKVKGKRQKGKGNAKGSRSFIVFDLKEDYGACSSQVPTNPIMPPPPRR
jgi:hypothetical protein